MAVWHVSGVGKNPGAVTMPLTYIYLLLKAASKGVQKAKEFFEASGERTQVLKGAPETIIIFTSMDVIEKEDFQAEKVVDKWYHTQKQKTVPKTIARYISNLLKNLKDDTFVEFYNGKWLKNIYFIEVNHEDFNDCFVKIGVTLTALKDKEIWINMIGGTNQINFALLTAGALFGVSTHYYYVFQHDISLLHPEGCPPDLKMTSYVAEYLNRWHELPIFQIDITKVKNLYDELSIRPKIHVKQLENMLNGINLAKVRGRLVKIEGDCATMGPLLTPLIDRIKKIEEINIKNSSEWLEWGRKEKILWELTLDGKIQRI